MKRTLPAIVVGTILTLTLLAVPAQAQVLLNSGFEAPDKGATGWEYNPAGADWTFTPAQSGISGPNGPWKCNSVSPDPLGDQFGYLQRDSSISQTVTGLTIGSAYEVNFFESYRTAYLNSNDLSVIIDEGLGTEVTIYNNPAVTNPTWEARTSAPFLATATSHTLTFRSTYPPGDGDRTTIIDGVTVDEVVFVGNPTVTGLSPADEEGSVLAIADLVMTFDRDVFLESGKTITIKDLDTPADTVITLLDSQVSVAGPVVTIDMTAWLEWSTNYAVQIEAGAFTDLVGNPYDGISDNTTWNFTTDAADVTGPMVTGESPADDATGASRQTGFSISFDEGIFKGTGNLVIKRMSDDSVVGTVDVTDAAVTVSGSDMSLNPGLSLDRNTEYYVEIDSGALEDIYGNPFGGISGNTEWNFTTSKIYYLPITDDTDCGITSSKNYTHAIDFGSNGPRPVAVVNGVTFVNGGLGVLPGVAGGSHLVGTGSTNFGNSHNGNDAAAPFLNGGDPAAIENLVGDMIYNPASGQVITLTGLDSEQPYEVRLYNRQWAAGDRPQEIGFNTDGVGTDISGAEDTGAFEEDNASTPDPGFATATQVNALSFEYTLPAGVTQLEIYINAQSAGSYHLYGLTNEEATDPTLVATVPADETIGFDRVANLEMTFSENILIGSGDITIKDLDTPGQTVITVPDSQVAVNGPVLTVNPTDILLPNTNYAIQVAAGAVTDAYGNAFAGIADDTTWNFTTGAAEFVQPGVLTLSPADDSSNISRRPELVLSFDEFIQKGTGNIYIKRASDDVAVDTIDVNSGNVVIDSTLEVPGTVVTITPSVFLDSNTAYYVEIDGTAIEDLSGNLYAGISDNSTWNFTTTVIYFVAINGDDDCGIYLGREYTHAIDFGNNPAARPVATVNGVVFANGGVGAFPDPAGSSQTVGTGSSTIPTSHGGNDVAAAFLTGTGMPALVGDMLYNNLNAQIDVTGLTPGVAYQVRLYHRSWELGFNRTQAIGFDTDGVAGAEATAIFNQDDATEPDPGFGVDGQVYALTYDYVLPAGVTTLTINIDRPATGTGSYHLYGLTNEALDSTPPLVTDYNPADEATGVPTYADLVLTFDDQMLAGTGFITIKNLDTMSDTVLPVDDLDVIVAGDTLTIDLFDNLEGTTNYAIQIDPGALTDTSGNPFAGIADDTTWNFTTAATDVLNPTVLALLPADDAIDVEPADDLVLTFSEDVMKGEFGFITIRESGTDVLIDEIDIDSTLITVSGANVTLSGLGTLSSEGSYYVEIEPDIIKDLTGNSFAGIAGTTTWNFSTRSSLVLQLKAADYDDISGVWTDSSGMANDATAPDLGATPIVATAQTGNGSDVVRFDGNDVLNLAFGINPVTAADGFTAFAYVRPTTSVTNNNTIIGGTAGALQYRLKDGVQAVLRQQQAGLGSGLTTLEDGAGAFSNINAQVNDLGGAFRLNGASDGPVNTGSVFTEAISKIGARNPPPGTEWFDGDIAEIRLYDRQLSLAEIQAVEAELVATYGGASTPYGDWATANGLAGPDADPTADVENGGAGDTLDNLLEFGFGTDPNVSDLGALNWDGATLTPGQPLVEVAAGSYKGQFVRRTDHGTSGSVNYRVELSADLAVWEDSDTATTWVVTPTAVDPLAVVPDYELVEFAFPATLDNGNTPQFMRISVIEVP